MRQSSEQVDPAKMRGPVILLIKRHVFERHRIARHVASAFRERDHVRDKHIIKPAVFLLLEPIRQFAQLLRVAQRAFSRVRLNRDLTNVHQLAGLAHRKHRVHQLACDGIPRGQGKQLRLVFLNEMPQDIAAGGELDVQKRRGFLIRGQQDKLPVATPVVEVEMIVQLIADLRRIARDIDMKIGEIGGLARQMFERTIIALHQNR
mmetsp:Transcript_27433/g.50534  ORF Transcript_27433/g.50534 Transcript_27433/m.50534 type:complete len:205 (-) Transcript_27433:786-1400(-)